jgi:hypothetical protein
MTWTDFEPNEGKMRAMGSGKSFSTSVVRGMGLVVAYSNLGFQKGFEHLSRLGAAAGVSTQEVVASMLGSVRLSLSSQAADKVSKITFVGQSKASKTS